MAATGRGRAEPLEDDTREDCPDQTALDGRGRSRRLGRVRAEPTPAALNEIVVAHPDAWDDRRLVLDLRACPGRRVLVLGNHDLLHRRGTVPSSGFEVEFLTDRRGALGACGFEVQFLAALLDTNPPLALTHAPVARVPVGAINVHGHLHGTGTPASRRLDVSVERTDYAPVRLDEVLELARGCG